MAKVNIGNRRARGPHEIRCGIKNSRKIKCPRGKGKWRGGFKCWGCPHATWVRGKLTGHPYGPSKPKEAVA